MNHMELPNRALKRHFVGNRKSFVLKKKSIAIGLVSEYKRDDDP